MAVVARRGEKGLPAPVTERCVINQPFITNESVLNISVMPPFCRLALFDRAAFPRE